MSLKDQATVSETKVPPQAGPRRTRSENLSMIRKVWAWVFLVVLVVGFSIASKVANNIDFITFRSVQSILTYATQILLIGLGETIIIIAAGIDLSVGWVIGFASIMAAEVMRILYAAQMPPVVVILAGFVSGVVMSVIPGLANGLLITNIKVPPFISTLGMGFLVEGVSLIVSGGYPVADQPPYLGPLGNNSLLYVWQGHGTHWFSMPAEATVTDMGHITALLPNVVLVTIIVTIMVWFILAKTQFGQHIYAIGGNYEASSRAGIPVKATLIKAYILAGMLAGVAGVLWSARFSSGAYNAGEVTTLTAIAAVVIGGASMFGGEGTIIGTIVGALCIATIQFGLVLLGVSPFYQYVAVGVVVILAVIVDQFGRTLGK